jgi:hypothetical protein
LPQIFDSPKRGDQRKSAIQICANQREIDLQESAHFLIKYGSKPRGIEPYLADF